MLFLLLYSRCRCRRLDLMIKSVKVGKAILQKIHKNNNNQLS